MTTYPMKLTCTKCGAVDEGTLHIEDSKPLTDEFLRKLHHIDEFGLFCDYDDFEQIARAIEAAHGIKGDA